MRGPVASPNNDLPGLAGLCKGQLAAQLVYVGVLYLARSSELGTSVGAVVVRAHESADRLTS